MIIFTDFPLRKILKRVNKYLLDQLIFYLKRSRFGFGRVSSLPHNVMCTKQLIIVGNGIGSFSIGKNNTNKQVHALKKK